MKYLFLLTLVLIYTNANAQMLQAVKKTLANHLAENKSITNYIGGLQITDAIPESDNKTITVIGTFTHEGFWSNVEKPFVAKVRMVIDELSVERLCYYSYLTLLDNWQLKCTCGKSTISPLPEYSEKL